jgi:hypothetical protein
MFCQQKLREVDLCGCIRQDICIERDNEDKQMDMRDLWRGGERERKRERRANFSTSVLGSMNYQKYAKGQNANPCSQSFESSRVVIHTCYDLEALWEIFLRKFHRITGILFQHSMDSFIQQT